MRGQLMIYCSPCKSVTASPLHLLREYTEVRYYQVSSNTFVLDKLVGRFALHRDVMVASRVSIQTSSGHSLAGSVSITRPWPGPALLWSDPTWWASLVNKTSAGLPITLLPPDLDGKCWQPVRGLLVWAGGQGGDNIRHQSNLISIAHTSPGLVIS